MVLSKSDGTCPSCGAATTGAPSVRLDRMEEAEAAAWRRHDEEKRERHAAAAQLRQRGQGLAAGGAALAALGVAVSVASYFLAASGGRYVIWSGAVVAGIIMIGRGRSLVDRAKRLAE
jgi:hypothetical protein